MISVSRCLWARGFHKGRRMFRLALICVGLICSASSLGCCCCGGCPSGGCGNSCSYDEPLGAYSTGTWGGYSSGTCGCNSGCCGANQGEYPNSGGYPAAVPGAPNQGTPLYVPTPGTTPPATAPATDAAYNGIPSQYMQSFPNAEPLPPPRAAILQQQYLNPNPSCPSCMR